MTTVGDAVDTSEHIPLKQGSKTASWWCCNEDYMSGSKFINIAFGTLTLIITVALLLQIYYGDYQVVPHGSVATDSYECSQVGSSILKKGGNAVDATIASAFCLAVVAPHLTSLDAGGQLLIYNHRTRLPPDVVDFSDPSVGSEHLPRLVFGLAYLHQQYGSVQWSDLVLPAANIAKKGFLITKMLVQAIHNTQAEHLYGRLEPGQMLTLDTLGETLNTIAQISDEDLRDFVKNGEGPYLTQALKTHFDSFDIYIPGAPSTGPLFSVNLKQIEKNHLTANDSAKPEYVYKLAKESQLVYNELNVSSQFHQGTSTNIAVVDLNDIYVSFVMGMYSMFGSGELAPEGYILDSAINKDTRCSRLPLIMTDSEAICGRRLVFGASDVAIASQIVMNLIVSGEDVINSIEAARFHMLNNGSIGIEGSHTPLFSEDVLQSLETLTTSPLSLTEPYLSCNIVEKVKDDLNSHSDSRGGGIASRF